MLTPDRLNLLRDAWVGHARLPQYPLGLELLGLLPIVNWLVVGGRGSGKSRLGAEWVNALARGLGPFSDKHRHIPPAPAEIEITVRQISATAGAGLPATRSFMLS